MRKKLFILLFLICICGFDYNTVYAEQTNEDWELPIMPGDEVGIDKVDSFLCLNATESAFQLQWNKVNNAEGYIIEQLKDEKWTRIARIGDGKTTSYKIEGLTSGKKYQFRIKTFMFSGNIPLYSDYVLASGTTLPAKNSNVVIGGRATDALRINWSKNESASGYIIEQQKDGKWVRIARIADKNTTTYRVEKLSAGTKYKFRIQAFGFEENKALYSEYVEINGTTLPTNNRNVVIGGWAEDALRINWSKNETALGYIIEQQQGDKWVRIARIADNNTTTYRVEKLSAGTSYKFRIMSFNFDGNTAIYSGYVTVQGTTLPTHNNNVAIGGRATDALRINWAKNESAAGYIIEQCKDGIWVRIARIADNNTITYRVEKLSAGTKYQFRIMSFNFDENKPLYSRYVYINGTTLPTNNSNVVIGGRAADALRINWTKNESAAGYIIEQYKDGKWVRIARIADKNIITYRVEKLSAGTNYKFRIMSFNFDGNSAIYSGYVNVSGTTLAK